MSMIRMVSLVCLITILSGCTIFNHSIGSGLESLNSETKLELEETLHEHGSLLNFQPEHARVSWTPDGIKDISSLLEELLDTAEPVGKVPEPETDFVFAKYEDFTLYIPTEIENPEQYLTAEVDDQWIRVTGDPEKVREIIRWASSQGILNAEGGLRT